MYKSLKGRVEVMLRFFSYTIPWNHDIAQYDLLNKYQYKWLENKFK